MFLDTEAIKNKLADIQVKYDDYVFFSYDITVGGGASGVREYFKLYGNSIESRSFATIEQFLKCNIDDLIKDKEEE